MPKQVTSKDVQDFMQSEMMQKAFKQPLPKNCQYILVNQTPEEFKANIRKYLSEKKKSESFADDPDFPGCPEGCECPSDKGCGIG